MRLAGSTRPRRSGRSGPARAIRRPPPPRPTIMKTTVPEAICTCTSTGRASIPSNATVEYARHYFAPLPGLIVRQEHLQNIKARARENSRCRQNCVRATAGRPPKSALPQAPWTIAASASPGSPAAGSGKVAASPCQWPRRSISRTTSLYGSVWPAFSPRGSGPRPCAGAAASHTSAPPNGAVPHPRDGSAREGDLGTAGAAIPALHQTSELARLEAIALRRPVPRPPAARGAPMA